MNTKSFNFLYPTTYEKNKEELDQINSAIQEAIKQRNYPRAKKLQQKLNYCIQVDNYFKEQKFKQHKDNESTHLKDAKLHEEEALKQKMINKMQRTLSQYEQRLQALEKKHQDNLNQIEIRFSNPRYTAYRPSSNIHQMLKAESFYASKRDFDSAEYYKNIITQKAHQEIIESETNTELSFSAAIENENRRYEIEKKGFHARLENEKVKLKTETERGLLLIKHKYTNLTLRNIELNKKPSNSSLNRGKSSNTHDGKRFSSSIIADFNNNTDNNDLSKNINSPRGNNRSFFVTTASNPNRQISGEESVDKVLNNGFSNILQRTEVQDKRDFCFPAAEPQIPVRSPATLKKTSYSRSPKTARTRRRPATNMLLSSTC